MRRNLDPLPFDAGIAAVPSYEFVEQFEQAYQEGDRERFILLGQRLAWNVTSKTIRAQRIAPYRMDMYSAGLLAMIEQFDRQAGGKLDLPYAYFRRVVYYRILQFLYRQGVLIRKGAKRRRPCFADTDISADADGGFSAVKNARAREYAPELSLAETIELCLRAAVDRPRTEARRVRGVTAQFDPTVTATPAQLHEKGMAWKAIGELLGISASAANRQSHKTPEQLRRQKETARRNREIGRLRMAGELERASVTANGTLPRGPCERKRGTGAPLAFDPTITATPKELREQGHTWKGIGELLGISLTAAYSAAHKFPHKSPEQLRQQALVSAQRRTAARKRMAAA